MMRENIIQLERKMQMEIMSSKITPLPTILIYTEKVVLVK